MATTPDTLPLPSPYEGWSREILSVPKAHVWPAGVMKRVPVCGITYPDGRDCAKGAIYRGDTRMMAPVGPREAPQAKLSGRHIWGGQVFAHFGHFICETIPRFWAHDKVNAESIVVIGKHDELTRFSDWQTRFIDHLGITLPVTFIKEPTEVEELLVPGPGFGLGEIARGTPEFREMLTSIPKHIPAAGPKKLYISRTKTGKKGGVLTEPTLEKNMAREGYHIYHPQEHSLEDQIAHYQAAEYIVGIDSSAFHLLGLVARPDQKIAIILRRNMMAYYNIQLQIEGMCGKTPDIINVLEGDWLPSGQKKPSRLSWGQIDHAKLAQELSARGFIGDPADWQHPGEKGFSLALNHFRKRMGGVVEFLPVEVPINEIMGKKPSVETEDEEMEE